jgi:enoyl-CoA hydratase/carnithine racemase
MDLKYILYEKRDHIAYVTINRPEVLNALHQPASHELDAVWTDFAADPNLYVAILTGAGERAFCSGIDVKSALESTSLKPWEKPQQPKSGFAGLCNRPCLPKPIISAVHGYCVGGGLELALATDIVVAADNTRMGLLEVTRAELAVGGGLHRLPRQIPLKLAMGMILTGRLMTAGQMERYGLVNEVVPRTNLMPAAETWAKDIIANAPLSVQATKRAVTEGLEVPLRAALNDFESKEREIVMGSQDHVEGYKAFLEKRRPQWRGV